MRCDWWLAQPKTEIVLRTALRTATALFALWALAVAIGLWGGRSAAGRKQALLTTRTQELSTLSGGMTGKRADAERATDVQTASPEGAGSAEFTLELSALAQTAGAEVTGVQIGSDAAPTTGNDKSNNEWQQETFECNAGGQYAALSRFLDGLAASKRVLEF
nr:hypothetical protein [Armatimonadota bacterium]